MVRDCVSSFPAWEDGLTSYVFANHRCGYRLIRHSVVITDTFTKYIPGFKKKKYDLWKFEEHVDEEGDLIKSYLGEEANVT